MANETVNININYKVSTGEVAKAEAATKKADAATNKLRQDTNLYAKEVGNAGKSGSDAMNSIAKSAQGADQSFGGLVGTVKAFIAALAVKEIANAALSMATLAGNVEGVERAFKTIPGSTRLLQDLRAATKGTVSDLQLMQTAIKARNFEIPLNQLGSLLSFAAAKAQQTGESVDYMVDSIIVGIGRESPLILDNLQLRMNAIRKVMQETGVALGEAVGIIARRQIEEMGGVVETGAVKVQKLKSAWSNFLDTVATKFYESSGFSSMLDKITNFLKGGLENEVSDLIKDFTGLSVPFPVDVKQTDRERLLFGDKNKGNEEARKFAQNLAAEILKLNEEYSAAQIQADGYAVALNKVQKAFSDAGVATDDLRSVSTQYLSVRLAMNKADVDAAKAVRDKLKAEIEAARQKQIELELERKVSLEIFMATEAKELQADAAKRLNAELAELEKSLKNLAELPPIEIFTPGFEDVDLSGFSEKAQARARRRLESGFAALRDTAKEMREEIAVQSINIAQDQLNSIIFSEVNAYQVRLDNLRSFYDEQISLAGDNTRAKMQLELKFEKESSVIRKQMAEKDKQARRFSTVIDTAAGVMKAFATAPDIYVAIVQAALVAATGISQLAKINREQPRGFAKGVINLQGPGTSTSDSIPARLSKGESVLTAAETKRSFGLLKAIRAKKIDDSVIKDLQVGRDGVKYVGMSDKRIVAAIEAQRSPDYMMIGSTAYEARKARDGSRKIIRSKSMGL